VCFGWKNVLDFKSRTGLKAVFNFPRNLILIAAPRQGLKELVRAQKLNGTRAAEATLEAPAKPLYQSAFEAD
jgi:hypothetical protein